MSSSPTRPEPDPGPAADPGPAGTSAPAPRHGLEVLLLLGVSLGKSAVYAVLAITELATRAEPLSEQTSQLNPVVVADRPWLDVLHQLAATVFPVVPALLAIYLLGLTHRRPWQSIGCDTTRWGSDLAGGLGLAALIGVPGLGLYLLARQMGLNTEVSASAVGLGAWPVLLLVARALMNGVLEEVIVVGYLTDRLARLRWSVAAIILASAMLRGTYHLYQGWGGFVGNVVMGVVFMLVYLRWRRVMPLVIAHTAIDVVAFVGYAAVAPHVSWL